MPRTTVPCPNCGREITLWDGEVLRVCPACGSKVVRDDKVPPLTTERGGER
jgi:predicted RNA-binding Zn-ribbon protein involved in translation (DUF1610 family)